MLALHLFSVRPVLGSLQCAFQINHTPKRLYQDSCAISQARTWADLLEAALPAALQEAAAQEVALRRATPVDFTECERQLLNTDVPT